MQDEEQPLQQSFRFSPVLQDYSKSNPLLALCSKPASKRKLHDNLYLVKEIQNNSIAKSFKLTSSAIKQMARTIQLDKQLFSCDLNKACCFLVLQGTAIQSLKQSKKITTRVVLRKIINKEFNIRDSQVQRSILQYKAQINCILGLVNNQIYQKYLARQWRNRLKSRVEVLKNFQNMSKHSLVLLNLIAKVCQQIRFQTESIVYKEGDQADLYYFVIEGNVVLINNDRMRRKQLTQYQAIARSRAAGLKSFNYRQNVPQGKSFGGDCLQGRRVLTALSETATNCLCIQRAGLIEMLKARKLINQLVREFQYTNIFQTVFEKKSTILNIAFASSQFSKARGLKRSMEPAFNSQKQVLRGRLPTRQRSKGGQRNQVNKQIKQIIDKSLCCSLREQNETFIIKKIISQKNNIEIEKRLTKKAGQKEVFLRHPNKWVLAQTLVSLAVNQSSS